MHNYMHEGKERRTELKFSCSIFSSLRRVNGTLGVYSTTEYLRAFVFKFFASFCAGYLEATVLFYAQGPF